MNWTEHRSITNGNSFQVMETKKCPYCGEDIPALAKKCTHCGMWIEEKSSLSKDVDKEHGYQNLSEGIDVVLPKEQAAENEF